MGASFVTQGYLCEQLTVKFATSSAGYDAENEGDASWGNDVVTQFSKAIGEHSYTGQTMRFEPVQARYVLFDTTTTWWSEAGQTAYNRTGLSEIRFMHYEPRGTLISIH